MVPEFVLRRSLATFADDMPALGYIYRGKLTMLPSPDDDVGAFIQQIQTTGLARDYRLLTESLSPTRAIHEANCPLGFRFVHVSLEHIFEGHAGVVMFTAIRATDIAAIRTLDVVTSLSRKDKKLVTEIARTLKTWSHPFMTDLSQILSKLKGELESAVDAYKEEAFNLTLMDYKNFVGSFCHEALSPMQQIRSSLEAANSKAQELEDDVRDALLSSSRALDSLRVSLEGMRLLFREEGQPLANQFRTKDLRFTVNQWCEVYRKRFEKKNVNFFIEPQNTPWMVQVIPEYLEVLIKNLVSNGVKYSFDASGYDEPGKFLVKFDTASNTLRFINFGVAIPADDIESRRILQLGHRAKTADDRGRVGKGVGMYLVGLVARLHGAEVDIKSALKNPGGNQKFYRNEIAIQFPVVNQRAPKAGSLVREGRQRLRGGID